VKILEQFISIAIFSIPGLLTYFWIQMFGINPTTKHSSTEMIGISALLWIPTTFLSVASFDLVYWLVDLILRGIGIDLSWLKITFLFNLDDIVSNSKNMLFLFYYITLSAIFSYFIAWIWSMKLYRVTINIINKVRLNRKLSRLSDDTSVWDSFFIKLEKNEESPLVVEIYNLANPEERVYGSIIRMSRPLEPGRSIILEDPKGWKAAHEYYQYPVKKAYLDTKSGIVVNELDHTNPTRDES
jgi:hypothetical protein